MKQNLKHQSGNVMLYVLVFFLFFVSWLHVSLVQLSDTLTEKKYLQQIDRNLEFELEAVNALVQQWPSVLESYISNDFEARYDCKQNKCTISIVGPINYEFLYVIIDR